MISRKWFVVDVDYYPLYVLHPLNYWEVKAFHLPLFWQLYFMLTFLSTSSPHDVFFSFSEWIGTEKTTKCCCSNQWHLVTGAFWYHSKIDFIFILFLMEEKLSSSSIHLKIPMILGMDFSCICVPLSAFLRLMWCANSLHVSPAISGTEKTASLLDIWVLPNFLWCGYLPSE